ncbi:MAG TPA: YciI family protein [Gaiellales bacterium]|nr:YciI family protein [Gaiellales bacterium]
MAEPRMDAHTLVLLMRPGAPPPLDDDAVDALQEQHLAFLQARREQGVLAAAGPFRDRPDERWRGMCIYLVDRERALELASEDPMVRAGWLETLALTWLSRPGELSYGPQA